MQCPPTHCPTGMMQATEIFREDADNKVREVQAWLKSKGVRNLEPVSLFCDQLKKVTSLSCNPSHRI